MQDDRIRLDRTKVSPEKLQPIISGPITHSLTIGSDQDLSQRSSFFPQFNRRAAYPSGQCVGGPGSGPLWPLAGFVNGRPEFKSSATLVNSQVGASGQLGFLILCMLCYI